MPPPSPKRNAVLREFRANPRRRTLDIAVRAGCSQHYAIAVISRELAENPPANWALDVTPTKRDALPPEPKRDPPVQQWPPGPKNIEEPQKGMTAKQEAIKSALEKRPRQPGESQNAYARAIATMAGVSAASVITMLQVMACEEIGRQKREEERSNMLPVLSFGLDRQWGNMELEIVKGFKGWRDAFFRMEIVADVYEQIAIARGDKYAESFMGCIKELCQKGRDRAAKG